MISDRSSYNQKVKTVLSTILPPILLIAVFAYWLIVTAPDPVSSVSCGILTLIISFLLIRTSRFYLDISGAGYLSDTETGKTRSTSSSLRHPVLLVLLIAALSRIAYYIGVYAVHTAVFGYEAGIFQMSELWNPPFSQGISALNISNSWYAAPGFPSSSYLPLFPFYPLLVSCLNLLTGNRFLAGLLISFLCFIFSSAALYFLVRRDLGNAAAFRAVRYLCILPPTFLLNLPAADSLFLLLSILTLLFLRRKTYYAAALTGAAAACTALSGVLLIVPMMMELTKDFCKDRSIAVTAGPLIKEYLPKYAVSFMIPPGTIFCILLIERYSGITFPWIGVSSALPNTGFTTIFQNFGVYVRSCFDLIEAKTLEPLYGYALPNLLCLLAVPAVLLLSVRKIPLSLTVYGIFHYLFTSSFGNLVSAPRYAMLCVPFLIGLSACLKNKFLNLLFSVLSIVLLAGYLYAYTLQWGVF